MKCVLGLSVAVVLSLGCSDSSNTKNSLPKVDPSRKDSQPPNKENVPKNINPKAAGEARKTPEEINKERLDMGKTGKKPDKKPGT